MMIKDGFPLRSGYLLGTYSSRVNSSGKLALVPPFNKSLKEHEVKDLWCYPDPTGFRIILCPPCFRDQYIKLAIENFPSTGDPEDHFRMFIFSGRPCRIDFFSKVLIPTDCLNYAKVYTSRNVTILGMGLWMEIFTDASKKLFMEMIKGH